MDETLMKLEYTPVEACDLLLAIERHCLCARDALVGDVVSICAAHRLLGDTRAIKQLLFARRLAERWERGEFSFGTEAIWRPRH